MNGDSSGVSAQDNTVVRGLDNYHERLVMLDSGVVHNVHVDTRSRGTSVEGQFRV